MATITAILNTKYKSKDGSYPIAIRVIDGKKQKLYPIGFKTSERYFENGQVKDSHPEADIINAVIDEEVLKAKRYFADCKIKNIPPDIDLVFAKVKSHSFTDYLRHRARQHEQAGQITMKQKVDRYVKELTWCFGRDVYFNEVTQDFLRTFETWLMKEDPDIKKKKNSSNTRHKKFEFLSKYFNNAISDKKFHGDNPFDEYTIKTTPVKKEKLTIDQFKAIEDLPLQKSYLKLCRDVFLFSYYCKGLRFENCIAMPKAAIINGRLHYTINKGLKHLSTLIHPKLRAIIDAYINNETDTIFGRLSLHDLDTPGKKKSKVGSENAYINTGLKDIALMAGIPIELSMHHARHSFAFHLKKVSNNIHVIKDSLGHSRSSTTETYLQSLDDEYLDREVGVLYE